MRLSVILVLSFYGTFVAAQYQYQQTPESFTGIRNNVQDVQLVTSHQYHPTLLRPGQNALYVPPSRGLQTVKTVEKTDGDNKASASNDLSNADEQNIQSNESNSDFIRKMASQLDVAQKHVSVLSDAQRYVLHQDPLVSKFVFGNQDQSPTNNQSKKRNRGLAHDIGQVAQPKSSNIINNVFIPDTKLSWTSHSAGRLVSPIPVGYSIQPSTLKYVKLPPYIEIPQPYFSYSTEKTPKRIVSTLSTPLSQHSLDLYKLDPIHDEGENEHEDFNNKKSNYEFSYHVNDHHTSSHFGHRESRSGKTTSGSYFVHLPDGRVETVNYWADKTGFHANVEFQGHAIHPPHL